MIHKQDRRAGEVSVCGEICVDRSDDAVIERSIGLRSIIETNHTDVHVGSRQNPVAIRDSEKHISGFFNSLKYYTISATTNRLCREQASSLTVAVFNDLARLFEPVTAEIRLSRKTIAVYLAKTCNILIAKFRAH